MAQGIFFFTKHNAKSKGPHLNMIQNVEKLAWEKFQSSFLTEIEFKLLRKSNCWDAWHLQKQYGELVSTVV